MAKSQVAEQQKVMSPITFETKLFNIGSWSILRLPDKASSQLPSRGQIMVTGTVNGVPIQTPLEPDGKWSHWFRVNDDLMKEAQIKTDETVKMTITPLKQWPEPDVPTDLKRALADHQKAQDLWQNITTMARWEWIRWIRSTNRQETRQHRIEVACSKLEKGMRRPCCWNRNLSTEPSVSKNGVLLEPTPVA